MSPVHARPIAFGLFLVTLWCAAVSSFGAPSQVYPHILTSKPAAYWPLQDGSGQSRAEVISPAAGDALRAVMHGRVAFGQPAQSNRNYPDFSPGATAASFQPGRGHLSVSDPGTNSLLDFGLGDTLTLETWVFLEEMKDGQNVYLLGKGRTGRPGQAANNQNYALRLRGADGEARPSFLFRQARNRPAHDPDSDQDWHRWTAREGFVPASGWHHVAVTYTFGQSQSLRGYLDGNEVPGTWDMGGATDEGPVVDDDEVWLGSSMGGQAGSSLHGSMNEVAIHRRALASDEIKRRFRFHPTGPDLAATELPPEAVRVEIFEDVNGLLSWNYQVDEATETYEETALAFASLPWKYDAHGVRADRSQPFLVRAAMVATLPAGEHQFLLRSLQSARLSVDGEIVATTPFIRPGGDGHGLVPPSPETLPPGLRFVRSGHHDVYATVSAPGHPQVFVLEAIIGGKGLRPEPGELSVSLADSQGQFRLLGPGPELVPHSDAGWLTFVEAQERRLTERNARKRREAAAAEDAYWEKRHRLARELVGPSEWPAIPEKGRESESDHPIDRFLDARLDAAGVSAAPLAGDLAFLRRLSLDTRGVIPTPEEIDEFLHDPAPDRRARVIDRFLEDPRWADHWVGYWQDVLAENPGILKPTLNNTGPFRYWIHESFLDNKPLDRFATELIRMEGSVYYGGPAGFRLATQNDVPMADRAQIVSQAFLAMNLACARCHDAPYHEFQQKDLFSLAAMLKKEAQEVPASSSIPVDANIKVGRLVNVTLHPGEKVDPAWPFPEVMHDEPAAASLRGLTDTREHLAAAITDPRNRRFAQVMANRMWKLYFGLGLVEPVDDWENAQPSHPDLLDWLAGEFVRHGYDWKHLARLLLNSRAYQREAGWHGPASDKPEDRLFASPSRRRMRAESLVDSLFRAVGKPMHCELLTLDNDSRRPPNAFLNFGYPQRAWQFTSLSNDRDRPALSLPRTQEIVDVLAMFGWRESRQSGHSTRDHEPNVLQPAVLANGRLGNGRIARLTDRCELTDLCLEAESPPRLVEAVSLRFLSRPPTPEETAVFAGYLEPGFLERVQPASPHPSSRDYDRSLLLSWSNHLNAEATEIMMAKEARESLGDPPTSRLAPTWRERMEDVIWAMINAPEFVFLP